MRGARNKQRLLEVACHLFAERGFHGTHVRDVCREAGVNVASVCYHFRDKRGLYDAVLGRARQTLSRSSTCHAASAPGTGPEKRLQAAIESLCARLSGASAWIVRLAARELVDDVGTASLPIASGLHDDWLLIQEVLHEWLGSQADRHVIRLHALGLLGQCVFVGLAGRKFPAFLPQIHPKRVNQRNLAGYIANFWVNALAPKAQLYGGGARSFVSRPPGHRCLQPTC
jgi:AcrR family transcriptional regulator